MKRSPLKRGASQLRRTPLKRSKRIRPQSDAHRESQAELRALYPALIERSGGCCELRFSSACRGYGEHPHHVLKRSQGGKHTVENLLWSCDPCNSAVEDEPERARARGLAIPSWEVQ